MVFGEIVARLLYINHFWVTYNLLILCYYCHDFIIGTVEKKSVGSSGKRGIDPENDRPSNNDLDDCSKRDSKSGIDFGFHVVKCIVELVNGSEGWSYREIEKFILCIRAEALGSNSCLVCQSEWMKELKRRKIHSPRSPSGSRR